MPDSPDRNDRYDRVLAPDADHELDTEEVRVLWDFVHGDIMDGRIRAKLYEHWGMCIRHAWGYALVEVELWQAGAGKRGGHQPFDVSILYAGLIEAMTGRLGKRHHRRWDKVLRGAGTCVICDDVRGPALTGIKVTHAGFDSTELAREANHMTYMRDWLRETQPEWQEHICPECSVEACGVRSAGTQRCRLHLIVAGQLDGETVIETAAGLARLRQQLLALTDSMKQSGADSTPAVDASWIRTMAWFHGWAFPLGLQPTGTGA